MRYSQGSDTGAADASFSVKFMTRANFQDPSACRRSTRNTLPCPVDHLALGGVLLHGEIPPFKRPISGNLHILYFHVAAKRLVVAFARFPAFVVGRRSLLCLLPLDGPVGFALHRCPTSS